MKVDEESEFERQRLFILKRQRDEVAKFTRVGFVAFSIVFGLFAGAYTRYSLGSGVADTAAEKVLYAGSAFMLCGMFLTVPVLIGIQWYLKREVDRLG